MKYLESDRWSLFHSQINEKSKGQNIHMNHHYDTYVADYTESKAYLWKIQRIFELIPVKPRIILDVGCSSGAVMNYANIFFDPILVCGIDISRRAISIGKKKYKNLSFIRASATNLPFRKGTFDLVTCFNFLEHFSNPADENSC